MADEDGESEFSDDPDEVDGPAGLRGPRDAAGGDDFDEFEDSMAQYEGGGRGGASTTQVQNEHFDEAVELSESEDNASPQPAGLGGRGAGGAGRGGNQHSQPRGRGEDVVTDQPFDEAHDLTSEGSVDDDDGGGEATSAKQQMASSTGMGAGRQAAADLLGCSSNSMDHSAGGMQRREMERPPPPVADGGSLKAAAAAAEREDDEEDEGGSGYGGANGDGGDGGVNQPVIEGMYDPAEYANLPVSAEVKELFQYITRYKPHNIELETKMRPFIPDYIPAVGDMDPFLKVPRPDGKTDNLGLAVLDEPASTQSDATVLTLQLRAVSKSSGAQPMLVRSVEHAEKDPKAISGWIQSIAELHRHKPAPSVRYSKPMPDIEQLMQIWPAPIEELLEQNPLPDADINLDLASYVRAVCAMLDIPVYGSLTEALHVLFTLYSDFKANVHFQQQLATEQSETMPMGGGMGGGMGGDNFDSMGGGMGGMGMDSPSQTLSLS